MSGFSSESVEVPCLSCCDGYCRDIPELCIDIEETDTQIIPPCLICCGARNTMFYWDVLYEKGLYEMWLNAGCGNYTKYIPIYSLENLRK